MEEGENRLRAAWGELLLASNSIKAVKAGMVLAGIANFR
jgi:hypothetical protein